MSARRNEVAAILCLSRTSSGNAPSPVVVGLHQGLAWVLSGCGSNMAITLSKTKWYRAGLAFECTQCGNCCSGSPGYVWVTKAEVEAIAKFLGKQDGRLDKRYVRRVGIRKSLTEKPNGDCVFLTREGGKTGCSIYPVRPVQCRNWPFWTGNLESPSSWNELNKNCPGINKGKRYDFVQIETLRTLKPGDPAGT